jgi:23S rRNA (guanosine2251-2'-O)-methyltransferase
VRRTCDHLLSIPMAGAVSSLNVSAAGAVVLYEAARQRRISSAANALVREPAPRSGSGVQPKKQKGLGS